jgi:hypothetical protein
MVCGVIVAACGGSPGGPGPIPPPPVVPPNPPPVVESVTASTPRAEVEEEITLTAAVRDAETPVAQLRFEWKAEAGTFTGEGASVTWRVPKGSATPKDYTVSLTVTETYGVPDASGGRPTNVVTGTSPAVRVHDSPRELAELAMRFLEDFARSHVPASTATREFTDSCNGKAEEQQDIEANRVKFEILSSSLSVKQVGVSSDRQSANMTVACSFTSRRVKCLSDDPPSCRVGDVGPATGDCLLSGRYEQARWWLCTSNFRGALTGSLRGFTGRQ